jgi:dephospho-CoA kinase
MRVLLTGMSATGKSTLLTELARRGYHAVDLDDPAWSEYRVLDAEVAAAAGVRDVAGAGTEPEWLWREDRVDALLSTSDADVLFAAGCAANQGRFVPRFDHVVLLTAPVEITIERLRTRTTNAFGKAPDELARILADKERIEPLLRRSADLEIDTTAPLDEVVDRLVDLVTARDPGGQ